MRSAIVIFAIASLCLISSPRASAACPSADLNGDCFVDFEDFAQMAIQWLTEYDCNDLAVMASEWLVEGFPEDPCSFVWVDINDPGVDGHEAFHGQMSKYETTNAQYCEFLNAALVSGDINVGADNIVYGANGSNSGADFVGEIYFNTYAASGYSQITYSGGVFSVRSRDGYDMSDHPVVEVSWYGATAFCNYYGYRLPTEWQWQAVADYDGSYTYGCGTTINQSKANYYLGSGIYCNPLALSTYPYTSPVDHYSSYGYGINDMAGNVWEWTDSWYSSNQSYRVIRGGGWDNLDNGCTVSYRHGSYPGSAFSSIGFRVCR